jgi:hypothetical protein
LELLLVDALATRLPKYEPEGMFLILKKMVNLNQIGIWPTATPLFLLLTDKSRKVQKSPFLDVLELDLQVFRPDKPLLNGLKLGF